MRVLLIPGGSALRWPCEGDGEGGSQEAAGVVPTCRARRAAQLAAEAQRAERAHGDLPFFPAWILVLGGPWEKPLVS